MMHILEEMQDNLKEKNGLYPRHTGMASLLRPKMEDADGLRENPNDFCLENPDFCYPSHWRPVLCDLCVYMASTQRPHYDLTTSLAFLLSLHCVPMASVWRLHGVLGVSTTTLPRPWRPHGNPMVIV